MTTIRWLFLILIAAVMFATPQTQAGDDEDGYRRHRHQHHRHHHHRYHHHHNHHRQVAANCVTDFWGKCYHVARHRHAYRWRYYHGRHRSWGHNRNWDHDRNWRVPGAGERIDHGLFCHARRRVVGEERNTRAKAQRASDNAWMGAVRYDHGERYQDLNHAKDVQHNCDPSSTTTILKRVFFRCVVEATPCRAPTGAAGERVERRYEEETDDDDK